MFEPQKFSNLIDIPTISLVLPDGLKYGGSIFVIVFTQDLFYVIRNFHSMVVWNVGKQVVCDVCVSNVVKDVVEQALISIDRTQCAFQPVPLTSPVMRDRSVCVL